MKRAPEVRTPDETGSQQISASNLSFMIAKWIILRYLAVIYFVSFLGALLQNEGLMGSNGIQPASEYFKQMREQYIRPTGSQLEQYRDAWNGFLNHPTLFWFISLSDGSMKSVNIAGLLLSILVLCGVNSWLAQILLWLLYFSIVEVAGGTSFYSYGWESQILETGFLAIFLCSLPRFTTFLKFKPMLFEKKYDPPSPLILWLFAWLCFRISMGAGLIKIRGSSCWTRRTCLHYHFETQPIPSPLSFVYHFLPRSIQSQMVVTDFVVQVYTSWFVLVPTSLLRGPFTNMFSRASILISRAGGFMQAFFMAAIASSGNFAVLNHLTIIPALACLDDACWPSWLILFVQNRGNRTMSTQSSREDNTSPGYGRKHSSLFTRKYLVDVPLVMWILYMSWPVVANLLQVGNSRQVMNRSFGAFRLVNTYGAFGSVGEARYEAIVQISDDLQTWKELEFPCKPGNMYRRPCFCAPYHYRIDWNIWFLGFKPHKGYLQRRETWMFSFIAKLLEKSEPDTPRRNSDHIDYQTRPWLSLLDPETVRYLHDNYYRHGKAPAFVKVDMYRYEMSSPLWNILMQKLKIRMNKSSCKESSGCDEDSVPWWNRHYEENLIPPVKFDGSLQLAT